MLHTLVVGLGRAGAGLHLPVLAKARARQPGLFAPAPVIGLDRRPGAASAALRAGGAAAELRVVDSLAEARPLLDPDRTVAHVCTPPVARVEVVRELLDAGFRRLLLEKPLAADRRELARLRELLRRPGVRAAVVAPWLAAALTDRLARLPQDRPGLGALREIAVVQNKPRFQRSFSTSGHPTAFDVEVPHALGVLLRLAGDAEVVAASCTGLEAGGLRRPFLGGATLRLAHRGGVRGEIASDLGSPVRERRITLRFEHGTAVGHYPADASDDHAQLRVTEGGTTSPREVFRDDALTAFLLGAYAEFASGGPGPAAVERQARVVELLCDAKELAGADRPASARRELADAR